jgi:alanine racemase
MDQIMVDVGKDKVRIGQDVVLIGAQDEETISVEEICRLTDALPYEITIGLTQRVPRLYLN